VSTTSTGQARSRPDPGREATAGCDISHARNSPPPLSPGSAFRGKVAQLPSADPFVLSRTWAAARRLSRAFIRQCGLAHGAEKDGNELGKPAADEPVAVALLSLIRQPAHHE
jgi:hypothetical protein